jgi:hypothetical protein
MMITVSWLSFWLDNKAVNPRFSLAGAEMRRNVLLLIGQRNTIYVPCSMTVTVSWFSFWLDHKAVSPRLSLVSGESSCFSLVRGTYTVSSFSFLLDTAHMIAHFSLAGV